MCKRYIEELIRLIDRHASDEGVQPTDAPGMNLIRISRPGMTMPDIYEPSLCLVARGAKEVLFGGQIVRYAAPQYLVITVNLPVIAYVTDASSDEPYLAVLLEIDPRKHFDLMGRCRAAGSSENKIYPGLMVGAPDSGLTEAIMRLVRLLDTPEDIPYLAPLAMSEICYRLLSGEHGAAIARLIAPGSSMQRIAQAIQTIKENFAKPLRVEALAEMVHMSPSAFYLHFKRITALSPLQYQKRLRLLEARRLILATMDSISGAAMQVGYESISQFSREYSRMFGLSPSADGGQARAL